MRVIDPWEAHCTECGEPDCYRSCPRYRPSRTGRCGRVIPAEGFRSKDGGRAIRFLEWGKLELLWHGGVAGEWTATAARRLNGLFEPLALALGARAYRLFRSVRWRVGRMLARQKLQPSLWRVAAESEREEKLRLVLRDGSLTVRDEWLLTTERADRRPSPAGTDAPRCLCAACRGEIEIPLPEIREGALFSIFPEGGGASGKIRFVRNELVTPDSGRHPTGSQPFLKCVAWDLDGVVWDGTLSEGETVRLRPGVMETVRALDEVGIVSSLCSKNDADIARAKLRELGIEEWFVFPQINWGPKSASLRNLAKEMNIGLDTIAFVDDRAENRAEVKVNCPGVRVWDEKACLTLCHAEVTRGRRAAADGLGPRRRLMYREEMVRRGAARQFAGDGAAFAAASRLDFELLPVTGERIGRCLELVRRTNQLNLTARRYDEAAFATLLAGATCHAVRAWDRYGDYGVIGFVALRGKHVVECCFSCRAAGRGIERRVLARLADGERLTADIVETVRNAPIREIIREFLPNT